MPESRLQTLLWSRAEYQPDDWMARFGIAIFFLVFGLEKFTAYLHWTRLFQEIGAGVWFRYFTGVVEVTGALLTLVPRLALVGISLLGATMLSATLILIFELHRPGDAPITGILCLLLIAFSAFRWRELRG